MDAQSFDYWMSHGHYVPTQQHHTAIYNVPPGSSKIPGLCGSPMSSTYNQFPAALQQAYYPRIAEEPMHFESYHLPMTPSEFGSDHGSPYRSPQPLHHAELAYIPNSTSMFAEKTHTTSGRRRAQNRAAQRAFRERKEKHARELEVQLAALTDKYDKLETSHTKLNTAYEKLREITRVLTQDNDDEGKLMDGKTLCRRSSISETLRKLLEILHGEINGVTSVEPELT